ncbi:MAG: TIGR01212 family radical SAM protein [Candidatus Rifleibacteriota bacterium]
MPEIINFKNTIDGRRLQKIPLDAGFTCPNRDGKLAKEGCYFCSGKSFSPFYCNARNSISRQINEGIAFFSKKYNCNGFLAYFQNYSCTYDSVEKLEKLYFEALNHEQIEGLVIATRPDCLAEPVINLLRKINSQAFLRMELGIESCNDLVLEKANRCHRVKDSFNAIRMLKDKDIDVCGHMVVGLPHEDLQNYAHTALMLSDIGLSYIKLHHLQIVKGSFYAKLFEEKSSYFNLLYPNRYIEVLSDFISYLRSNIVVERLVNRVPVKFLIAPRWQGFDEQAIRRRLLGYMRDQGLYQGCKL